MSSEGERDLSVMVADDEVARERIKAIFSGEAGISLIRSAARW